MILPTPEEIVAAKADAMKRFGRDELLLIKLEAPINFALLVAPFDLKRWGEHTDAQAHDLVTSHAKAVLAARCWPDAERTLAALTARPASARRIAVEMYKRAGQSREEPRTELLADLVAAAPPDAAEILAGLSPDKARALLAEAHGAEDGPRELWGVRGPGSLSCVLETPDPDVYLACLAGRERAAEKRERIVGSYMDFVKEAIRWSSVPIDVLLDDRPAHAADLRTAYLTMGGETATASTKSV